MNLKYILVVYVIILIMVCYYLYYKLLCLESRVEELTYDVDGLKVCRNKMMSMMDSIDVKEEVKTTQIKAPKKKQVKTIKKEKND